MRCYLKGSRTSPLAQFSCSSQNDNDSGDAGGIPVFTFWSIAAFGMCILTTSDSVCLFAAIPSPYLFEETPSY